MEIQPKHIAHGNFMGSVFQNSECETILRNIVMLQKSADPEQWTPFTWEQYKDFCTHKVSDAERGVLDAFVKGGKPVWNTSAFLQPGWLDFDGANYTFTPKMIEMLYASYSYDAKGKK